MKIALHIVLVLLLSCLLVASAADASLVRVEFAARVLPPESCGEQRDAALARALAPPGSQISGEFEYDAATLRSPESIPNVAHHYYFQPKEFRASLSIAQREHVNVSSNGMAWISSALLGRGVGQPKLGFTSHEKRHLAGWPGEIDRLVFQLVVRAKDDAPRMDELPSSAEFNSISLSGQSRLSLFGERSFDQRSQGPPTVWLVCGDLISLGAEEELE